MQTKNHFGRKAARFWGASLLGALVLLPAATVEPAARVPQRIRGSFVFAEQGGENFGGCDYFEDQTISVQNLVLRKAGRSGSWLIYRLDAADALPGITITGSTDFRCPPSTPGGEPLIESGDTSYDADRRPSIEMWLPATGRGKAYLGFVIPVSEEITRTSAGSGTRTEHDIRALPLRNARFRVEARFRIGAHTEGPHPRGGTPIGRGFYFRLDANLLTY